jgi:hypothetical protein
VEGARNEALAPELAHVAEVDEDYIVAAVQFESLPDADGLDFVLRFGNEPPVAFHNFESHEYISRFPE